MNSMHIYVILSVYNCSSPSCMPVWCTHMYIYSLTESAKYTHRYMYILWTYRLKERVFGSLQLEETIHHILGGGGGTRRWEQNVSHRNNFGVKGTKGTRATEVVFLNFVLLWKSKNGWFVDYSSKFGAAVFEYLFFHSKESTVGTTCDHMTVTWPLWRRVC